MSDSSNNAQKFKKGEVLFVQGEEARDLYIVLKGSVKLFIGDEKSIVPVGVVYEKDFFGEQSIFSGNQRSLTAVVAEDSELILIKKENISEVLDRCSDWVSDIMKLISSRLEDTNKAIFEHGLTDEVFAQSDLNISNDDLSLFKKNIDIYKQN